MDPITSVKIICVKCNNDCDNYYTPNVNIVDCKTMKDVSYEVCPRCIEKMSNCSECNNTLLEPWTWIFIDSESQNHICGCCYKHLENPVYKQCLSYSCKHCSYKR